MALITNPTDRLTLGGLVLGENGGAAVHDGYTIEVSSGGEDWGEAEAVVAQILTALRDGDVETTTRFSNRTATFQVRIRATTGALLAAGEAAITRVLHRPAELHWQPPGPDDPVTVFEVVNSRMRFLFNGQAENRRTRTYEVTLRMTPWPRALEKTITAALPAPPVTPTSATINDASSTTGWTSVRGTVSTASGYVQALDTDFTMYPTAVNDLTLTGTFNDFDDTPYLLVEWQWVGGPGTRPSTLQCADSGDTGNTGSQEATLISHTYIGDGWIRTVFEMAPDNRTTLPFTATGPTGDPTSRFRIRNLARTDELPAIGTRRQSMRAIAVRGSVATDGDILVAHDTDPLNLVVVHTHPTWAGYQPALREHLILSDTPTVDATTLSGAWHPITSAAGWTAYEVPVTAWPPGEAHLWAVLRTDILGDNNTIRVAWTVASYMGADPVDDIVINYTDVTFTAVDTWQMIPLGMAMMPPIDVGPDGTVQVSLVLHEDETAVVDIDEAYLFAVQHGTTTIVDLAAPTEADIYPNESVTRLKILAPSLELIQGGIRVASLASFADYSTPAAHLVVCPQVAHRFDPDGSMVFVATSGAEDAEVSFEHYERAHSNIHASS